MIGRYFVAIALLIPAGAAAEDFDAKAAAHIVRIVVSGPQDPDHVAIRDPDEANAIASGLGAAIASGSGAGAGVMAAKTEATVGLTDFDAVLQDRNVKLGTEMKAAVTAAMQRDGYAIQNEPSYNTDAALNLSIDKIWYNAPAFRSKLTPEMIVHVRFIDMNSHDILFDKDYHFANPNAVDFGTPIPAPARFAFASYDAVLANPDAAIAGLRAAIPLIAAEVGKDLIK
jgi:hypothetical protein